MLFLRLMIAGLFVVPSIESDAFAESSRQFAGVAAYYSTNYSGRTACGTTRQDSLPLTEVYRLALACV